MKENQVDLNLLKIKIWRTRTQGQEEGWKGKVVYEGQKEKTFSNQSCSEEEENKNYRGKPLSSSSAKGKKREKKGGKSPGAIPFRG